MGDFIELGIEAADKLVDKHFDKVPDSALHIHTYHPKNLSRKASRRRRGTRDRDSEFSSSEEEEEYVDSRRRDSGRGRGSDGIAQGQTRSGYSGDPYAIPPRYSRDPPRMRPQYIPSPPPAGGPPYSAVDGRSRRDFDETYYSDSNRRSPPRRPRAITRRSSSYHGPRSRYYSDEDSDSDRGKQMVKRRGSMVTGDKAKDSDRKYNLKGEIEKNFTKSSAGITGSVLGALVGGWAARQAQESQGRNSEEHKKSSVVVTALGAAVGGLAANAAIDRWEDSRQEADQKQAKWEEKWGSDDERDWGKYRELRGRDNRDRGGRERDGR